MKLLNAMSSIIHLVALVSPAIALPNNIFHVSIDNGPAPPPADGPPLAASAIRDKSYLPAQVGSIIGAYFLCVLIIGTALLLVGRRLRRAVQASPRTLAMEMVKPLKAAANAFDPSPISPARTDPYGPSPVSTTDMRSAWPSPELLRNPNNLWGKPANPHKQQPSIQSSVVTFDETVVEDHKAKAETEMERLYAAVMEHDEQKARSVSDLRPRQNTQHPPELQHLRTSGAPHQPSSLSLRTDPKPPSRISTTSSRVKFPKPSPISPTGTTTHSRASSRTSLGSFNKKRGVRGLTISPPMGSPDLVPQNNGMYGETEPLSPRYYDDPGPPPPTPPQKQNSQRQQPRGPLEKHRDNTRLSPTRAEFRDPPHTSVPVIQATPEELDTFEESQYPHGLQQQDAKPSKRAPPPLPLSIQTQVAMGPTPTGSQLPLRSAPLPLRNHNSNYTDRPRSTIKATILERKAPTVTENGLRPPLTGVPMTPYSPYMPFTPLTPMTPSRLVTRQERKRKEKEEGRRVATREDAVEEEADMWGDAYH